MLQIEEVAEPPFAMFAWSFSQGTGKFTAIAGLEMKPKELAISEATKVVVTQGSTQVTKSYYVSVKEPIVTTR